MKMPLRFRRIISRAKLRVAALRAKWPPVPQNVHRQLGTSLRYEIDTLRRENAEIKASMDRVLPKLVQASMNAADPNRYRLILEMDPFLIREAFMFGNDQRMIECFSERVGYMVRSELATMNMHRFEEIEGRYSMGELRRRW